MIRLLDRTGIWRTYSIDSGLIGQRIEHIAEDSEGYLWFATWDNGVSRFDGDEFQNFTRQDGLINDRTHFIFKDSQNRLWFGTLNGVCWCDGSNFHHLEDDGIAGRAVQCIYEDGEGRIWCGGHRTLGYYDGTAFHDLIPLYLQHYEQPPSPYWLNQCRGIAQDRRGDLLGERPVSAIAQDRKGQFIFGCWESGFVRRKEELYVSPLKIIYQQGQQFQTIFQDNEKKNPFSRIGTVIAGRNGEVYFYLVHQNFSNNDKGFGCWHPEEGLKFYGIEDGLINNNVNDLLLDRNGNLWIATQSGLCCFDGTTFRTFTTEDGLLSNRIHCLHEDRKGHLWLGTDGGVAHFDGQLFQTIKSPHIGPVLQIIEDHCDGTFWFGTVQNSLVRYRLRKIPPQIRLIQVVADQVYEDLAEVIVSTTDQQVIFEYKGMGFSTHPRDMLYVYRLKGHDPDWRPATRKMRAHYRDLPPGDYTFQVRAVDRDLNYSEIAQARLSVEMDPRISALTSVLNSTDDLGKGFIGQSAVMHEFQIQLRKAASTDLTILILGETGVGKGLAARVLHALSTHCDGPFIRVNCGALPETLIDSELFGHERGAFTSAVSRKLGKVELAKGGTLFLDEIGDMAPKTQARMLHLLDEGIFERVGGNETLSVQTRIVAATNRNLEEMVSAGAFRQDLYYRFRIFPIYLPPLRERKEDIPDLAEFFKHRMATHLGTQIGALTPDIIEVLQSYDWPGNVRELEHLIQRSVIVCRGSQIKVEDLELYHSQIKGTVPEGKRSIFDQDREVVPLEEFERRYLLEVLKSTNYQITGAKGAATLLGLPPSTLYSKMKKLGIKRP